MPEGDTIHRTARTLERVLAGRTVTRFESVFPRLVRVDRATPIIGRRVDRVRASGKHLLVDLSGDLILRTHLRMHGSWHVYREGERWQRRPSDARIVLGNGEWVAVGFSIPVAEFLTAREAARQPELAAQGPDLLAPEFDRAEALRRMRERPAVAVADALLDQRIASGLGNVYKSEVLFLCRVDPFVPVGRLEEAKLGELLDTSRRLMTENVAAAEGGRLSSAPVMRRTTRRIDPGARFWVYGRKGEPCRVCGAPIRWAKQGVNARSTYWCPGCQT
ncbi:MAG: Fpg/Nei family DNA glycosylase [Thermoanaerobaculia bacterium]